MAPEFANLVDLFARSCARWPDRPLFGEKREGAWRWTRYRELARLVDRLPRRARGARRRQGRSRRHHRRQPRRVGGRRVRDLRPRGERSCRCTRRSAPANGSSSSRTAAPRSVIAATTSASHDAVAAMRPSLPSLAHVVALGQPAAAPRRGRRSSAAGARAPVPAGSPAPESIAGFVYTSGTTGKPKGVLLSHGNLTSNVNGVHELFTFEPDDRSLAFLPWAHAYGQTCEVHALISMGGSVAINDDIGEPALQPRRGQADHPRRRAAHLQPHLRARERRPGAPSALASPRIIARRHARRDQARVAASGSARSSGSSSRSTRRLVFAKIRAGLGGRLKYAISASSATLGREVAEFVDALGITVYEGYGLTETSPIVSANLPGSPPPRQRRPRLARRARGHRHEHRRRPGRRARSSSTAPT